MCRWVLPERCLLNKLALLLLLRFFSELLKNITFLPMKEVLRVNVVELILVKGGNFHLTRFLAFFRSVRVKFLLKLNAN